MKPRFSQLCPLLQCDGLNALWHAVKAIWDCLYQFYPWHGSHRVLDDSAHRARGESCSSWLHMHAKAAVYFLIYSHPHTQINNGIAGRRVSHCPSDPSFPAKRIKQGGREERKWTRKPGGMNANTHEVLMICNNVEERKEGRKDGWMRVAQME